MGTARPKTIAIGTALMIGALVFVVGQFLLKLCGIQFFREDHKENQQDKKQR
ncbi:MAG TPA: hypothetical protein VFE46_14660 [Pirellulales bacterium]|jgi:hypothetical protein|nr:hypothetical protein [Pirellulales bacterium]